MGERYVLRRCAGSGGYGEVWEAVDGPAERRVALKLYPPMSPVEQLRVQREIEALHLLKLPGVVALLDHGRDGNGLYLVMDWVEGAHFPPGGWSRIGPTALSLLRTLVAMHDAGVVHRDIKPANVLVRPDGAPVLVDFGLATGAALNLALTRVGVALGTPRYRAPEQVRGDPVDGRADVYALGVMLYEALAGSPPHDADTEAGLTEARLLRPPPPLRGPGLDVPGAVADVIAAMLRLDPADRLSARQALLALSGERAQTGARLPWLGSPAPIAQVVDALRQGRSIEVGGAPGSGRTRLLEEVEATLGGGLWLARGERPFASIPFLSRDLDPQQGGAGARAEIAARLAEPGLPVLGDDWAAVDPWTREVLDTAALPAGQVRVVHGPAEVVLMPLGWEDLLPLFEGHDRVLHSREDPARLLWSHSGGNPARTDALLRSWVRRSLLEPTSDGRFCMQRESIDALAAQAPLLDGRAELGLPAPLLDLLGWVRFCAPHSRREVLAAVTGLPTWELDLLAEALVDQGGARWDGAVLVGLADAAPVLTEEGRAAAHAALADAIPPGAAGRLRHLVAAGRLDALVDEALAASAREEEAGRLGPALEAVETARRLAPEGARLEGLRIRLLLAQDTVEAAQQAAFLAQNSGDQALEALATGKHLARAGRAAEALPILEGLAPFSGDDRLEMARLIALNEAARRIDVATHERVLHALAPLPIITDIPAHQAQWAGWMGLLRFHQGRHTEAGALHEQAAQGKPILGRLASLVNAGRARLEAHEFARAEMVGAEALALARDTRNALREAEAEWILRSAANRRGATEPDTELVRCAVALGDARILGQIALNEGFVAWRGRRLAEAATFATLAAEAFVACAIPVAVRYAEALRFAADGTGDPEQLSEVVLGDPQELALDMLALLAGAGACLGLPTERLAERFSTFPAKDLDFRRGAYIPREALVLLGVPVP